MKLKILITSIWCMFLTVNGFSQDSTKMHAVNENKMRVKHVRKNAHTKTTNKKDTSKIYRDTRLGSSEPQYNTYKKNHRGAGAVTTSPKK